MFQSFAGEVFECKGTPRGSKLPVVSALKVSEMLLKGCISFLVSIVDTTKKIATELANVRVVYGFSNVFPEELLGLPSSRGIELLLGTAPISKALQWMAPAELKELNQ